MGLVTTVPMLSALNDQVKRAFTKNLKSCKKDKQEAIQKAGSAAELAKLLGITRQAISLWGDQVPMARVWQLKALRPEWFKH